MFGRYVRLFDYYVSDLRSLCVVFDCNVRGTEKLIRLGNGISKAGSPFTLC